MRLALIPAGAPGNHQWLTAKAVASGMERHGDEPLWITASQRQPLPPPRDVDGVLVWSWRTGKRYRERGYNVLLMERAYFGDRFVWTSLGWNGLNNRARFAYVDDGGARFRKHFAHLMQPWRPSGRDRGYALIMGQVPSDSAVIVAGVQFGTWATNAARELQARGWKVKLRPHPKHPQLSIPGVSRTATNSDFEADLAGAGLAVTLNSNAGVLAVLYGTATVTCDPGAIAWDVTAHDFDNPVVQPDRDAWAARIAYSQWLLEEIADGTGWEHVRAAFPGNTGDPGNTNGG